MSRQKRRRYGVSAALLTAALLVPPTPVALAGSVIPPGDYRVTALVRAGDLGTATNHLVAVMERLQPWQRADGLVFSSAQAALNTIPRLHRAQPSVVAATEFVDTITKEP